MEKGTSQRSMSTEATRLITEASISTVDIHGENADEIFPDLSGLSVRRRPSESELVRKAYQPLPTWWKLDAKWPPISPSSKKKKASNKKVPACDPKSLSNTNVSLSPSCSSEISSLTERENRDEGDDKTMGQSRPTQRRSIQDRIVLYTSTINPPLTPSRSEHPSAVSKLTSPLASLLDRDGRGKKTVRHSQHERRTSIKDKIDLYESFSHRNSFTSSSDTTFDLQSPVMKLRNSFLGKASPSGKNKDSQEVIDRVPLSPDDTLSRSAGRKIHRRISYRFRYGTPDLRCNDDKKAKDDAESKKASEGDTAGTRGGGIRGIHGYSRSCKWISWDESGSQGDKIDRKDDDNKEEDYVKCTITNEHSKKGDVSCENSRYYQHPDLWITPITSRNGSRLWIAKRVWDKDDRDEEEIEYLIEHLLLMDGIRGLMGIPERPDEWEENDDEIDPWETSAEKDSAPAIPRRHSSCSPLYVNRVIDIDGQYKASSRSVLLDQENFSKQLQHNAEFWKHNDISMEYDSDCDASFNSLIDYFSSSDDSSIEIDNFNRSYKHSSQESPKSHRHSQRGFGRPDEWIRPHDLYGVSSERNPTSPRSRVAQDQSAKRKSHHKNQGYDFTQNTHEESVQDSKAHSHSQGGFGRPDEWIRPDNLYEESSGSKPLTSAKPSRTAQDQSAKESSPRKEYACSNNGSPNAFSTCELTPRNCETHPEVILESHISINTDSKNGEADKGKNTKQRNKDVVSKRKSKTCAMTHRKSETHQEVLSESRNSVTTDSKNEEAREGANRKHRKKKSASKRKSKTHRKKSSSRAIVNTSKDESVSMGEKDSEDVRVRGTPTWEKKSFQQSEDLSDIKVWWEI